MCGKLFCRCNELILSLNVIRKCNFMFVVWNVGELSLGFCGELNNIHRSNICWFPIVCAYVEVD